MIQQPETLEAYLASLNERDRKRYQALLQSNTELRSELQGVAQTMADLVAKKKHPQANPKPRAVERNDQDLVKKKQTMADQQQTIQTLKSEVKAKKLELEKTYNFEVIREKQDELNHFKRMADELRAEKATLDKVKRDQEKYLAEKRTSSQDLSKKSELLEKLRVERETAKALADEKYELEKEVNLVHNQVIGWNLAKKNAQMKAEEAARLGRESETELTGKADLAEAEEQIEEMKRRKETIVCDGEELYKVLEKNKRDMEKRIGELEEATREREKVLRLNLIKMREARRESQPVKATAQPEVEAKAAGKQEKGKENIPNATAHREASKQPLKKAVSGVKAPSVAPAAAKPVRGRSLANNTKNKVK